MRDISYFQSGSSDFWIEMIVAVLFLLSSFSCLFASLGLLRLKSFYARLHMTSLLTVGSFFCIDLAYMLNIKAFHNVFPYRGIIFLFFLFLITPIQFMILSSSAFYREMVLFVERQKEKKKINFLKGKKEKK